MNNIYKVIWSKAKNCYVVASEIARSHTKSASGSEKIGGVARHALLALGAACAIACGGFVNVGAVDTVHVDESSTPPTAHEVYTKAAVDTTFATKTEVNAKLDSKADKTDVGKNTTDIATNKGNITKLENEKLRIDVASATYATKTELTAKADMTALGEYAKTADVNTELANKADKTYVDTELTKKADVTALGEYAKTADVNTELAKKANQADLDIANDKITALQNKTVKLSADGTELKGMTTVETDALKVTGGISNGTGVTTTLTDINNSMTQTAKNKDDITNLKTKTDGQQTAINGLNEKTTQISYDPAEGTTVHGVKFKGTEVDANGKGLTGVSTLHTTGAATIGGALTAAGVDAGTGDIKGGSLNVTGEVKGNRVDAGAGEIKTTGVVNAGTLSTAGNATVGGELNATGKVSGNGLDAKTGDIKGGNLSVTGAVKGSSVDAGSGEIKTTGAVNAGTLSTTGNATVGGDLSAKNTEITGTLHATGETKLDDKLTVKGEAIFGDDVTVKGTTNLKNTNVEGDLKVTGTITTDKMIFGDKPTNYTEIDKGHITSKNAALAGDATQQSSSMEFDRTKLEVGVADKNSNGHLTMTADKTTIKNSDLVEKNYSEIVADKDSVTTTVKDEENNTTSTKSNATEIRNYAKDAAGNKTINLQTATQNKSSAKDKDGNESSIVQTGKDITNTAEKGTITNTAQTIVNNASGDMTNTVGGKLTTTVTGQATEDFKSGLDTTVTGTENHKVNGTQNIYVTGKQTNTVEGGQENIISGGQINKITGDQTTTVTGKVTETYKAGQETNVTGDKKTTVTGKTTEEYKGGLETTVTGDEKHNVTGNQENIIGGDQTTKVTGDISNTAKNITNEASNSITDRVGTNTRVLDNDGITDTVGGSTFKQRIDKIMMESKDVSIKAEETLTNEAKVITNKASEVINNEAININNTATGIITSKASEIKNQADKLISNKVGENTWENMENGKITTSIKDGAKQNLTQSDAAGTTQSTVDGTKSTVTIQNADGLVGAVTDGTYTSVQNQTASAIATDVKDKSGNENASVANATTSVNTITNGTKANTVISTAEGTSFINSEAAAPVGAGTVRNTTIKGNTITTGKVTMDYAEVMNDLGVHGSAKVDNNLEVGGTSTLKGDVTMESNATVKKNLTVEGITTTKTLKVTEDAEVGRDLAVGGNANITGDVTARSYKVGGNTYIDANGINANNQKITNVADGSISEGSKDAVNGGQLYGVKRDLEHQVDKVGANAAAMANLRPMEFDPSSKWNIAAAIGNYGSETAAALGAFYRPNDNVMVNLSTAFGTGENMVGGGVSVRLGKGGNKLSREETNALKAQVADLTARMDALLSVLNPNMSKDFPDVPENHWAYEAVSRLAGNDIVQGYPDGEFHGERTMTRYEMAEIIYNALSRGAEAERELVEEFKPELQAMAASEKATAEKAEG